MQIVLICEYDDEKIEELTALFDKYSGNHISANKIKELSLDYFPATEFFMLVNTGQFDPTKYYCINCDSDLIN